MKKLLLWIAAFATLAAVNGHAQDVTGQWQGTLHAGRDLRIVMSISKDNDHLAATMYSIDQGAQPIKATTVTLDGTDFKFTIDMIGGSYEGKLSADGKQIVGTWTQGGSPLPFTLDHTTKATGWEIPAPPPPPKLMAADADPSFDVATIKPNDSGATRMQQLTVNGRNFKIRAGSLGDMLEFAFGIQGKQIVNAPDWLDKDRYDVDAVPDQDGAPNPTQVRTMIRKLLQDRYGLKFHHDKRELSAFVLTVAKTGSKLKPTQLTGPLPGLGISPGTGGVTLRVVNGTMTDFSSFLQTLVLDRPVVDQTALTGKFDFNVTFTPDDSQFNGHSPIPKPADGVEPAASLYEALTQQLGLKLTAEKTQVDVIVIDHVEKPSAN